MGFMGGAYEGSFTEIIRFLTLNERIYWVGGAQLAYNIDLALVRVSVVLVKGAELSIPGDRIYTLNGPADVAEAIKASMRQQISFMRDDNCMRAQKESFREKLQIMQRRVEKGKEKPGGKNLGKEEKQSNKESDRKERERKEERKKGGGKRERGTALQDEKEEQAQKKYTCMRFLGGSLKAKTAGGAVIQCKQLSCNFLHKKASELTLLEAEETMAKTRESFEKRAIQKAVEDYKNFLK
jgi:hypothetical protein